MSDETNRPAGEYASPACAMHETDPAYMGLNAPRGEDVMRWRKAERARRIAARTALPVDVRREHTTRIIAFLEELIEPAPGLIVSAYWPMRGEPDLRPLIERLTARGARCALPVVAERAGPLEFRAWAPGERLERGVWNIPVPAAGAALVPNVVLAPVVAFDRECYRLGYGGGYFDRTLAALTHPPRVLGVGYALAAIPTIYPQPHDVPMEAVVTEEGVTRPNPSQPR